MKFVPALIIDKIKSIKLDFPLIIRASSIEKLLLSFSTEIQVDSDLNLNFTFQAGKRLCTSLLFTQRLGMVRELI